MNRARMRASTAAALFGIPLACLVAALSFLYARSRPEAPRLAPPVFEVESTLEGWTGQRDLSDGSRLVARLVRLHPETERQSFDARALAERLELAPGEPWRLDLRRLRAPPGPPDPPNAGAALAIDLRAVAVADARGTALVTIAPTDEAPDSTPDSTPGATPGAAPDAAPRAALPATARAFVDPLRTLLAPPAEPLVAGTAIELVLWGRAPEDGVRIEGLACFAGAALALERAAIPSTEVPSALARLDREMPTSGTEVQR